MTSLFRFPLVRINRWSWIVVLCFSAVMGFETQRAEAQPQRPNGFHKPRAQSNPASRAGGVVPGGQRQRSFGNSPGHSGRRHPGRHGQPGWNRGGNINVLVPGGYSPTFGFYQPYIPRSPFSGGVDVIYNYDYINPTFAFGNTWGGSAFGQSIYSRTMWVPFPNGMNRTEYNATQIQALLERQNSGTVAGQPLPPGFNIADKTSVPTDDLSVANQLLAEAAFRNGQYQESGDYEARAIARDRDNGYLWLFSSQVHFANGRYLEAGQDAGLAMKLLPENEWFWVVENFREFYRNDGYVRQMQQLSRHIQSQPNDGMALTLRAYHYLGLGYPEQANADLENAAKQSPNHPWTDQLSRFVAPVLAAREKDKNEELPPPAPKPTSVTPTGDGKKTD